ncbi:MAG: HAD family hydrolase [Candidatus Binataceae bacterium]|jgi:HAD superfamily hydrolase (TIGR01549 family)
MPKHDYKALVLDLFDTLVKWEPERLPLMELGGQEVHTTMPWVFPKLAERLGDRFVQDHFVEVYMATVDEINLEREREWTEISCADRFVRTLERYLASHDIGAAIELRQLAEELTRVHMDGVRAVTSAPIERAEAVRRLAQHYRLGLLSNFDDAQCGREVLLDSGVADLFEAVIISAEVGLRKPNQRIYRQMLEMLKLDASNVLFVGDTPREDVHGPLLAGMHAAWISKGAVAIPDGIPAPNFIIRDLSELPDLLGV